MKLNRKKDTTVERREPMDFLTKLMLTGSMALCLLTVTHLSTMAQAMEATAIRVVSPVYPEVATDSNISGTVTLKVEVNCKGEVIKVDSTGEHRLLVALSERAVRRWVFKQVNCKEGNRISAIRFVFTLLPTDSSEDQAVIFSPRNALEIRARRREILP